MHPVSISQSVYQFTGKMAHITENTQNTYDATFDRISLKNNTRTVAK